MKHGKVMLKKENSRVTLNANLNEIRNALKKKKVREIDCRVLIVTCAGTFNNFVYKPLS